MRKKLLIHTVFLAIACIVTLSTAFRDVEVFNKNDLRTLSCGWPLKFTANDLSYRDPPFPWKISCFSGEWGDLIEFYWPQFIINVTAFYAFVFFFWSIYIAMRNRI